VSRLAPAQRSFLLAATVCLACSIFDSDWIVEVRPGQMCCYNEGDPGCTNWTDGVVMTDRRIDRLEHRVRLLGLYALLTSVTLGVLALSGFTRGRESDVLRVRGVIIEDSLGRERILIGAPIPQAENRVRTDMERVARIWGRDFPPAYVRDWYPKYRNDMDGILVLDGNGFDRVAVGQDLPDPNIGRRIGKSTGMVINDSLGFERSGYSLLTVNGKDRVVIGLDQGGAEALTLVVDDAGRVGLTARDGNHSLQLGTSAIRDSTDASLPVFGLIVRDSDRVVHQATTPVRR